MLTRLCSYSAIGLACWAMCRMALANEEQHQQRFEFSQVHMGMPIKLILYAANEPLANSSAEAAYRRMAQLDQCMSDYKDDSELTLLSASAGSGRDVSISSDLWTVLQFAQRLAQQTDGAFDVTVGPLTRQWRRARRYKQFPSPDSLAAAREATGYKYLVLDEKARTARLIKPGMRLDLGGIAAGYAADAMLQVLRDRGVDRAMVDASGDVVVGRAPPGKPGWVIAIESFSSEGKPLRQYVSLENASLTTSGDAFQFVELDGKRYSHIVDPRTGLGLTNRLTVTVVAPSGMLADSLATAVSVLGQTKGAELTQSHKGVSLHIISISSAEPVVWTSAHWPGKRQ